MDPDTIRLDAYLEVGYHMGQRLHFHERMVGQGRLRREQIDGSDPWLRHWIDRQPVTTTSNPDKLAYQAVLAWEKAVGIR